MKKILFLIFSLSLVGCTNSKTTKDNQKTNTIKTKYKFEDVIKNSNYICTGTLKLRKTGTNILDNSDNMPIDTRANYTIFTFDVTSTIYDSYGLSKNTINVYTERKLKFEENKEYFLPLTLVDYAYFVEDIFTITGGMTLSFTDFSNNTINEEDEIINEKGTNYSKAFKKDDLINYVDSLSKGVLYHYTKETNKDRIILTAPIILKIKIEDLAYTRDTDYAKCETYIVKILDVIKGKKIETTDTIKIEFAKGIAKKNDTIYVAVEPIGQMVIDTGIFYGLTSTTFLLESDFNNIGNQ